MNSGVFSPSFKFERKTKALNVALWGFVGLISLFSVGVFVFIFHIMLCYVLDIKSTFISSSLIFEVVVLIIFTLTYAVGIFKFVNALRCSYKFEDNKIIKGAIINVDKVKGIDLAFDAALTAYMAKNILNPKNVAFGNAVINVSKMINLIMLNTNQEFVNKFFDTDIYKKKIYNNPRLLKETKYNLVYICENNKKLVIPKLYEGMNIQTSVGNERSLLSRILVKSLIVFGIFFLLSMVDLFIGMNNNYEYISNINNTCETIQTNLNNYGYSITKDCNFQKVISDDRTSTIRYNIDIKGRITDVDLELYYDFSSYSDSELKYIISTLNTDFSDDEINKFVERVSSCVNGNCSYGKIESDKNTLILGSSSGFVDVHNR